MMDSEAQTFLEKQHRQLLNLVSQNSILELITPHRFPSREFLLSMLVQGLARCEGQVRPAYAINLRIRLPEDYQTRADSFEILEYLGPHEEPWHPNIHGQRIFLPIQPGQSLVELVQMVFDLWTWKQVYTQDAELNAEIMGWSTQQPEGVLPVEHRKLNLRSDCCCCCCSEDEEAAEAEETAETCSS